MNIWKLTYNEVHKGGDVLRVDPAAIATEGDVLEAASILSDQVRGPQSCEDPGEDTPLKWEVVGIELIGAVLVCEVDYVDPSLNLRISA